MFRAHYALISRPLVNSKGMTTSGLFNLIRILRKLREDKSITKIAFCMDSREPSIRKLIFPGYKSSRQKPPDEIILQLGYLPRLLSALGIPRVEFAGLEADDLIAGLTRRALEDGEQVVILSSDKDLGQLVQPGVILRVFEKGLSQTLDLDSEGVKKKYGIAPESVPDFLGLAGDKIDDIPGIRGIGEKTALELLKDHPHLEDIYADLENIKPPRVKGLLTEFRDQANQSRDLARLIYDLPPEVQNLDLTLKPEDTQSLGALFQELEFKLTVSGYIPAPQSTPQPESPKESAELTLWDTPPKPVIKSGIDKLNGVFTATQGTVFFFDGEQTKKLSLLSKTDQLPPGFPLQWAVLSYKAWLERDLPATVPPVLDLELCDYLIHPELSPHSLAAMLSRYFQIGSAVSVPSADPFKEADENSKESDDLFRNSEEREREADDKAEQKAHDVAMLAEYFQQNLPPELRAIHDDMELPLVPILVEMEKLGIKLDITILAQISAGMKEKLADLEARIHGMAGGDPFNIQSPQQLAHVLFDQLKLPLDRTTKTGRSTDIEVLTKLSEYHEMPKLVIQHRTLAKLKNTYTDALPMQLGPDGRLHTHFQQTVASTGRLSSTEPNLQNIPIRDQGSEIRRAFVAEPGWCLLSADYSQIELRILAHFSHDEGLMKAFQNDEDIHKHTASELFEVDQDQVTNAMRSAAKMVNFGIAYGLSSYGLAKSLGIPQKVAVTHITRYFQRYPGVKKYIDSAKELARERGYAVTLLGRRLPLKEINSPNGVVRSATERVAINMPIQGTAADMIKLAMIKVHDRLKREMLGLVRLVLTIHDELLLEVKLGSEDAATHICREEMQSALPLDVPCKVDIHCGANWLETHKP